MNWEAVGAVAEFLGSMAVLLTLLFIAVQVRESRKMNAILLAITRTDNVAGRIADHSDLAAVVAKVRSKVGDAPPAIAAAIATWDLTPVEAEMWFRYMGTIWRGFEAEFGEGGDIKGPVQRIARDPQHEFYLRHSKGIYDPEFHRAVTSYIAEGEKGDT